MAYLTGEDRYQSSFIPRSLDELISENNPVRVIDAYIDSINLERVGFIAYSAFKPGQKPYRRQDLLKITLYCYMNKIRSSRMIEKETKRNIELMWLTGSLTPDHGTISGFIKDNKIAIKELFKEYVLLLKGLALVDGDIVAIDGTKIKASNAKNKHFNHNKIKIKLDYHEARIREFLECIEVSDTTEYEIINEKIEKHVKQIDKLKKIQTELKEEKKKQVCLTDSDSKSMRNNGRFEPCYNLQTAVDRKNKLIIAYDVVDDANDQVQLKNMVDRANKALKQYEVDEKAVSEKNRIFVLDTGYYNRQQIIETSDEKIEILIKKREKAPDKIGSYDREKFIYNPEKNSFICPEGHEVVYKYKDKKDNHEFYRYRCVGYEICENRHLCTKSKRGREINISASDDKLKMVEHNTLIKNNVYKRRGQIVEHPFGTIKRHFGFDYFLRRGFASVKSEAGLILLAYNLKRTINILGVKDMVALIKA